VKYFKKIRNLFLQKPLISLSIFYFLVRFPNLTLLPIFNDEAIYLDWGWRETHVPGYLYYSLYDAKQPLMMWLFGISQSIFSAPLFAGRLVSLILGFFSTIGIFFVAKKLFNTKIAIISAISYTILPIFVLFDRQALLESAITTVNVWSFYFLLNLLPNLSKTKYSILTGITLGLGFFSKSTAALFLASTLIILGIKFFQTENKLYLKNLGIIFVTFLTVISLLIINPQFWQTLPSNSRYVLTLGEIFKFPILLWIQNVWALTQICFIFLSPPVFVIALLSAILFIKRKQQTQLLLWVIIPLLITLLGVKSASQRYFVSLLPFITILFSYGVMEIGLIFKKNRIYIALLFLVLPFAFSFLQIYNPLNYFLFSIKLTTFSEAGNITGQVSGYGVHEIVNYLTGENKKTPLIIAYAENTGNPESGVEVYVAKNKDIEHGYFESKYLGNIPKEIQCINTVNGKTIYFISRNDQLTRFEKYVKKIKTFSKPLGNDTIGIYEFVKHCENPLKVKVEFQR
jgi:4-amino-4-deoxy-L-arabinose transferase-like glycosyltransferase